MQRPQDMKQAYLNVANTQGNHLSQQWKNVPTIVQKKTMDLGQKCFKLLLITYNGSYLLQPFQRFLELMSCFLDLWKALNKSTNDRTMFEPSFQTLQKFNYLIIQ